MNAIRRHKGADYNVKGYLNVRLHCKHGFASKLGHVLCKLSAPLRPFVRRPQWARLYWCNGFRSGPRIVFLERVSG